MSDAESVVFIIDDDAAVRRALSRVLQSHGLASVPFGSAEEFLDHEPCAGPACMVST